MIYIGVFHFAALAGLLSRSERRRIRNVITSLTLLRIPSLGRSDSVGPCEVDRGDARAIRPTFASGLCERIVSTNQSVFHWLSRSERRRRLTKSLQQTD